MVTVDALATNDTTPALTGTVDDNNATISVTVNGNTYAAEESLEAVSDQEEPVEHPLLPVFFDPVDTGSYIRNDEHWPGWEG